METNVIYNQQGEVVQSFQSHLKKIFLKMAIAMGITAIVSFGTAQAASSVGSFFHNLLMNPIALIFVCIMELGVAVAFRMLLLKISPVVAEVMLYGYAFLTGLTFSVIFAQYEMGTIYTAFLFSAVLFGSCAVIGYTTNIDLSKFRGILFAGLVALLAVTILSVFIPALRDNLVVAYGGLIIFLFYTAYDIQIIRNTYETSCQYNPELADKFASLGAFELYIDFINIFLKVLQILARSRSRN